MNLKKFCIYTAALCSALSAFALENLIPETPQKNSMNTWCTWGSQSNVIGRYKDRIKRGKTVPDYAKDITKVSQRDGINEETVFGENGWAKNWGGIRKDCYFILDDGWDVGYYERPAVNISVFGSHILNETRFPSVKGMSPQERLKWLNDKLVANGWLGGALWISAQKFGENYGRNKISPENQIEFWKERIAWSKYANIRYWKVDWGIHCLDVGFRKMLTKLAAKEFPELIIENAYPALPANFINNIQFKDGKYFGDGKFANTPRKELDKLDEILEFSTLFRTYDTYGNSVTLDRCVYELNFGYEEQLNLFLTCEDNPKIGAGLASFCGEMRAIDHRRAREFTAFIHWQRIAPALAAKDLPIKVSNERLSEFKKVRNLPDAFKKRTDQSLPPIEQSAPAVIVRGNMDLPEVKVAQKDALQPYVLATKHTNATLCVSFVERDENRNYQTDTFVNENCLNRKIGVFGQFNTLTFTLPDNTKNVKVFVQDLTEKTPKEIKNFSVNYNKLTIGFNDLGFEKLAKKYPAFVLFVKKG